MIVRKQQQEQQQQKINKYLKELTIQQKMTYAIHYYVK